MRFVIFTLILAVLVQNTALGPCQTTKQCCRRCAEPYFSEFCFNGGRCYIEGPFAICKCLEGFIGDRCHEKYAGESPSGPIGIFIAVITAVVLLLGLVVAVAAYYYARINEFIRNLFP